MCTYVRKQGWKYEQRQDLAGRENEKLKVSNIRNGRGVAQA